MPMQRRALLLAALMVAATPARAADPTGIWTLDREAWTAFVDGLVPRIVARMPKAQRDSLAARGVDVAAEVRAGLTQGIEGSIELRPNGRAVARNRRNEPDSSGLWRHDGELIEIDLQAERLLLRGTWQGDRMQLKPVLDPADTKGEDPLWIDALRQMTFVLLRQG
jgi:hypothetical protein